jgi:hypothetical protein
MNRYLHASPHYIWCDIFECVSNWVKNLASLQFVKSSKTLPQVPRIGEYHDRDRGMGKFCPSNRRGCFCVFSQQRNHQSPLLVLPCGLAQCVDILDSWFKTLVDLLIGRAVWWAVKLLLTEWGASIRVSFEVLALRFIHCGELFYRSWILIAAFEELFPVHRCKSHRSPRLDHFLLCTAVTIWWTLAYGQCYPHPVIHIGFHHVVALLIVDLVVVVIRSLGLKPVSLL